MSAKTANAARCTLKTFSLIRRPSKRIAQAGVHSSVRSKTDPKTVQALLRHSDVKTTLQLYAHSVSEDRLAALGQMLHANLQSGGTGVNLLAQPSMC